QHIGLCRRAAFRGLAAYVCAQLHETAGIEQFQQSLARIQLAGASMAQDFLLAAHGLGGLTTLLQVPQNRTPFMVIIRQLNVSLDSFSSRLLKKNGRQPVRGGGLEERRDNHATELQVLRALQEQLDIEHRGTAAPYM
ncbi:MAG: hypothetical protein JSS47_21605, partial [Proteobacteria bacterium]|nr:hypothetical protein [Pseudomonadota bacterium]